MVASEYTKGGGIGFAHTIQKFVFVALIAALIELNKYLIKFYFQKVVAARRGKHEK